MFSPLGVRMPGRRVRGLVRRPPVSANVDTSVRYPASGAEWGTAAGFNALTNYWRMTQEGVDVVVPDLVGSADLTPLAMTQGTADEALNSLCAQFTAGSGNDLHGANAGVLDPGEDSFLVWTLVRLLNAGDNNARGLFGKRGSAPHPGYEQWVNPAGGTSRSTTDNGADPAVTQDLSKGSAWGTTPLLVALLVDRNDDNWQVFGWQAGTGYQSAGSAINAAAPDLTSDSTFRFGNQVQTEVRSPSMLQSAGGAILGTDAEGFTLTHLENLAEWMRLP